MCDLVIDAESTKVTAGGLDPRLRCTVPETVGTVKRNLKL